MEIYATKENIRAVQTNRGNLLYHGLETPTYSNVEKFIRENYDQLIKIGRKALGRDCYISPTAGQHTQQEADEGGYWFAIQFQPVCSMKQWVSQKLWE